MRYVFFNTKETDARTAEDLCEIHVSKFHSFSLKGGDPAAPSDTATLLRLHPSY